MHSDVQSLVGCVVVQESWDYIGSSRMAYDMEYDVFPENKVRGLAATLSCINNNVALLIFRHCHESHWQTSVTFLNLVSLD